MWGDDVSKYRFKIIGVIFYFTTRKGTLTRKISRSTGSGFRSVWEEKSALLEFFSKFLGRVSILAAKQLDEIGIGFETAVLRDPEHRKPRGL